MKNLILTITTSLFMLVSTYVSKAENNSSEIHSPAATVNNYLESTLKGNVDMLSYLYGNNFEYIVQANGKENKYSKKDYLNFLTKSKDLKYNCESSYTILDANDNYSIAKVSMKFDTFERIDYITLCREDNSWKVNKITTTYL